MGARMIQAARPVVVIGAGPYGLAAAAELQRVGVDVQVFGRSMSFWEEHMPAGMFLRSSWDASHIGRPEGVLNLASFEAARGARLSRPIPISDFVSYGRWFAQSAHINIDERMVVAVKPRDGSFELVLEDGESVIAGRVVIAAGIREFAWRPEELRGLPPDLATHSSEHRTFERFAGRRVLVIGGGQSAVESGALLAEAGAGVEILIRGDRIRWLRRREWLIRNAGIVKGLLYPRTDVGPIGLNLLVANPRVLGAFPRSLRERIARRAIRPAVATWLADRLAEVVLTTDARVVAATAAGAAVRLRLADGSERVAEHVVCATGFRADISAYPFLPRSLAGRIRVRDGLPALGEGFESSVPRLHFLGAPSAGTFGPLMRFVSGTDFAAGSLARAVSRVAKGWTPLARFSGVAVLEK